MKRLLSVLLLALIVNGCDDGNLILDTINFDKAEVTSCSNGLIYKLNDKESLIIDIPTTTFENKTNSQEVFISTSNRVVYRFYSGAVAADNICETIPPATPSVIDQWTASAGTIKINTTAIKTTNTTTNSTRITGYNHAISFANITFAKSTGNQVYETFPFGDYKTTISALAFGFDTTLEQCSTSKEVYNYNNSEALTLAIDPNLIKNEITPLDSPRKGIIGTSVNKLVYRLYTNGILTPSYFCGTTIPLLPTVSEEWVAAAGVTDVSGIIEVTTTTNANGFKHTIVLKKVKFKNGTDDFLLGDTFAFGELLTTN